MIFSDFYISQNTKIEILPTDSLLQETNVLEKGDRIILVLRPIGSHSAMSLVKDAFIGEFKHNYEHTTQNISELLLITIEACGNSLVNPPADFKLPGEVEVLIVYETLKKDLYVAKVGLIKFKQRKNGKFKSVIKDSNPLSAIPNTEVMVRYFSNDLNR